MRAHTCSENSATSMKSLWNWAEVLQGWDGATRGTVSSSGRAFCSSSCSSPKPPVPVKASRSGEPIIFTPWRCSGPLSSIWPWSSHTSRGSCSPQPSRPASTAVSQLFETRSSNNNNNNWRVLKLLAQLPTGNQRTQNQAVGFKSHFLSTEQSRRQRFLEDFSDGGEKRNFPADCSHKADMSRDLSSSFWQ